MGERHGVCSGFSLAGTRAWRQETDRLGPAFLDVSQLSTYSRGHSHGRGGCVRSCSDHSQRQYWCSRSLFSRPRHRRRRRLQSLTVPLLLPRGTTQRQRCGHHRAWPAGRGTWAHFDPGFRPSGPLVGLGTVPHGGRRWRRGRWGPCVRCWESPAGRHAHLARRRRGADHPRGGGGLGLARSQEQSGHGESPRRWGRGPTSASGASLSHPGRGVRAGLFGSRAAAVWALPSATPSRFRWFLAASERHSLLARPMAPFDALAAKGLFRVSR